MASFPTIAIIPAICLTLLAGWLCFIQFNNETTTNGVVKVLAKTTRAIGNQKEFDYFLLALQWPATYCRNTNKCCSTNGCCRGSNSPTGFTIHGLWTDYNDGSWPSCCNGPAFDANEISSLLDGLNKYWPSLSCSKSSTCHGKKGTFWAHEWEKHGTCSYPVVEGEYNYFLTTLNLYFTYNVTAILSEAGYVSSNSEKYPLGGIISAVQNSFHATPEIICTSGALEELRICFYKDFTPRDCDATSSLKGRLYSSSCPDYVSLPAFASLEGLENNGTTTSWITGKSSI